MASVKSIKEGRESGRLYQRRIKRRRERFVVLNCHISECVTPSCCTKILAAIAKYIITYKLISCPYEALRYVAQSSETPVTEKRKSLQSKRHHRKMIEAYNSFENIFKNIELELQSCVSSDDAIEEVALLLGATIRSPQEIYRIKMPSVTFEESIHKQGERILLHLIRSIVLSEDFNDMLSYSMSPTNMYVMLKKKSKKSSEWFMPKESYDLPNCSRQAVIDLSKLMKNNVTLGKIAVLPISMQESECIQSNTQTLCQEGLSHIMSNLQILPSSSQWFQSRILFKGFRLPK